VLESGWSGRVLDPIKIGSTVPDLQEGIKAFGLKNAKRCRHTRIQVLMHLVTDVRHQTVQCAKGWELKALLNQVLNGQID
jgi:hypothetical protein